MTDYYAFNEPAKGLNSLGEEIVCNQLIIMTEEDAIAWTRNKSKSYLANRNNDSGLLQDFIAINWASKISGEKVKNLYEKEEEISSLEKIGHLIRKEIEKEEDQQVLLTLSRGLEFFLG